MRAFEFLLVEGYKEAASEFYQVAPAQLVDNAIDRFRDLVNRNQVQGQERNIDHWRTQGWSAFKLLVDKKGAEPSKTQVKRKKAVGKSVFLREDNQWLIVIPLDKNASCFYGKNSSWCTTKPERDDFEKYFYRNDVVLVYCIRKQDGGMFAIAGHPKLTQVEIFDQQDKSITPAQFKSLTGLDSQEILKEAMSKFGEDIKAAKGPYVEIVKELDQLIPTLTQRDTNVENKLLQIKDGKLIHNYVSYVLPDAASGFTSLPDDFPKALLFPLITYFPKILQSKFNQTEQEQLAAIESIWGAQYVKNPTPRVIDRALTRLGSNIEYFPVNYETMVKYPKAAAWWARKNKTRVPEAEAEILKDPEALFEYLMVPVGRQWPDAETAILGNTTLYSAVARYAKNFLKARWPEGEELLLKSAATPTDDTDIQYIMFIYAKEIIKGPWPEAEKFIIKDPETAALYATDVLKRRWREAEPAMLEVNPESSETDSVEKYFYFIGRDDYRYRWPDFYRNDSDEDY
jgi:hypothetical protein